MFRNVFSVLTMVGVCAFAANGQTKVLVDFETPDDLRAFEFKQGSGKIVPDHATSGKMALAVKANEYMNAWRAPVVGNWTGFDVLRFDYFNATGAPVAVSILVGDKAWREKEGGTYWNRHNSDGMLNPGAGTFTLPVKGLYRGEAGSRNNDIKRNIDVDSIIRLDIGFRGQDGEIYIDNLRLESASVPEWVKAFDFGPGSQPLEPGFTGVSFDTVYSDAQGYGFHPQKRPWTANAARDDTFPSLLLQDFVEARDCEFQVALKDGKYRVWLVYDDCGYWGGEQARHSVRSIEAEGKEMVRQERPLGWAHALYDFEDVEPLPGVDMWKTYMEKLFKPVEFDVDVTGGKLELVFKADREWSSKVAAVIIYPAEKSAEGRAFTDKAWEEQRKTFTTKAVCMDGAAGPLDAELAAMPVVLFKAGSDEEIKPNTVPSKDRMLSSVAISAARGEHEPVVFGMRANVEMKNVTVRLDGLTGKGGAAIAKENIKAQAAWYIARRGFNSINYHFETHTLRPAQGFNVPAGITREIWVDIFVPETAAPGDYTGKVVVEYSDGKAMKSLALPVKLTVWPFKLNETDFVMGFYGVTPPGFMTEAKTAELQRGILQILRDHRMNSFSGGEDVVLKGFENGEPVLDFTKADEFMKLARSYGFNKPYMNYGGGGIRGLFSSGYVKGEVGKKLEEQTGLPYEEVCRRVLNAYKKHAEENNYLPVIIGLVDETRVVEHAREQIELQKTLKKAAPWLMTGGSYSVSFAGKADELHSLLQEMFKMLRVNALNNHDQSTVDMAKQLGNELWIYNQGQSRYSFGYYQWSEYVKGVKGRMQWHLFPLHGWQYFDLDGREPDTGVIAYHSKMGILPTIHLARVREGVEDMLYCQTLSDTLAEKPGHAAAANAKALLEKINAGIKLNERRCPQWLDMDKVRAEIAQAIVAFGAK